MAARYGLSEVAIDRAWRSGELPAPLFIGRIPFWPADVIDKFEARLPARKEEAARGRSAAGNARHGTA